MANNRLFPFQALNLGEEGLSMNVASLGVVQPGQLGAFYAKDNKVYQLVQALGTGSAISRGMVVCWSEGNKSSMIVTKGASAITDWNQPAGVVVASVLSAGNYGLIQVKGPNASVNTGSAAVVKGDILEADTSGHARSRLTSLAGTSNIIYRTPIGVALSASQADASVSADGSVVVNAWLDFPLNF